MTATDELRRLLDERGVEYDTHGERYGTWYGTPLGGRVYVPENNAGYLHVKSDAMTPEQAIAATLGNDGAGRTKDGVAERERDQLKAENAKLRKLCRSFAEYTSQDRCEGCACKSRCNDGQVDECWQFTEIRELASELGLEAVE